MATFVTSQRGSRNLSFEGYLYTKQKKQGKKTYWICEMRRACNGRAVSEETEDRLTVRCTQEHQHAPSRENAEAAAVRSAIKRKATDEPASNPARIIREETLENTEGAIALLPHRQTLRRIVNRARAKLRPVNPRNIIDLRVVDPYDNTITGEQFLVHDNLLDNEDEDFVPQSRLLIFTTENNIRQLFSSPDWFADGTFSIVPNLFFQLWTIHGVVAEQVFPLVYVLASNKTQETYTEVLNFLKDKAIALRHPNAELLPVSCTTDMELAAVNAISAVFPRARIQLCFFHFAQAIYRKTQELGLTMEYNEEGSEVKKWIHSAISLAFTPPEDTEQTFQLLRAELANIGDQRMEEMANYIGQTYISGRPARGRRRAVPPRYSPLHWSVYDRTLNRQNRTNYEVEGYHNRLNKIVNKHHPSMFTILDELWKEQRDTDVCIAQLHAGHVNVRQNRSRKAQIKDDRIYNIVRRYQEYKDDGNVLLYLRSLGYNVAPHA